ncbi:WG repeat-containing protein [Streptomyces sp. NPDC047014]|uniref:WG repeat-containing protein n=1 Tax=Streptomyces sp. NPDC047014 TaxID=3155736 RepID=UPI0034021DBC
MTSATPAPPPYVVPCGEPGGGAGAPYALVGADGRLVRAPGLSAVGAFHPDGQGGYVAPAADRDGRCGYLDHRGVWLAAPELAYTEAFGADGLSRFQAEGGLWGFAGTDGVPVVPAALAEAAPFRHGLAAARTEDGMGHLDTAGRFAIRPRYAAAGAFAPNGLAPVRTAENGLCGYIDRTGRTAIEPRFDGARPFGPGGTAPVRVGELWGLVDGAGGWVVEPCFAMLEPFQDNGLAFVLGGTHGARFRGYVNARGEVVIRARDRLSQQFRCGLVRFDDGSGHGYHDATGEEVIEPEYEWAEDFDTAGAAVAHYLEPLDEEGSEEARAAAAARPSGRAWGVLRADGRFLPVDHLEPLTDAGGWILGFGYGTGLAAFVTRDGAVAHVDREGRDLCWVEAAADGTALRLVDPAGAVLWETTGPAGSFARVEPAHCPEARSYLVGRPGAAGVAEVADVTDIADGLLAAEPRPFEPCSLLFESREDPYAPTGPEDADPDDDGTSFGAMAVLARTFLSAEHQREFPFLQDWAVERFGEIEAEAVGRLTARFGAPLPGAGPILRSGDGESSTVWQAGPGARRLVLQSYFLVGDGDVEIQLWLAAVDPAG